MRSRPLTFALLALLTGCQRCRGEVPPPVAPPGRPTTLAVPAAAAAPAQAAAPAGPAAEAEAWRVVLEPPASVAPGASGAARVRIAARGTFHVNPDYPLGFEPDAGATARFASARVPLAPAGARTPCEAHPDQACELAAALPFTAPAAGDARLAGTVLFSVCNEERCLIERARVAASAPVR